MLNNSYGPLIDSLPLSLAGKGTEGSPAVPQAPTSDNPASADSDNTKSETRGHVADAKAQAGVNEYSATAASARGQSSSARYFAHPASVEAQRIVWIPRDPLGLAESEVSEIVAQGIGVSMAGAEMDEQGRVDVDGPPPGEEVA